MPDQVRVRIAPSPTGAPHVGTAYIALFNLAFARQHKGRLLLRIEDTDQTRSRHEYELQLLASLRWLGLEWDEGPDVGGPCGPYRQSERLDLYSERALKLVADGHAYHCFCSQERLASLRAEQSGQGQRTGYDGHCRQLAEADVSARLSKGESNTVRMKVPEDGTCVVSDRLRGEISFELAELDDQVILKSDGFPTYHLAVVVDDHLMEVSHVIRGEEWINSMPKHVLLYDWLGWEVPEHTHLPLLLNPDKSKMSKRRNPTSVDYYQRAGYLPQALLNYLALMAHPPGSDGEEKFNFDDFVERFDLSSINLGGSVFDVDKLTWLNGRYIREDLSAEDLLVTMKSWLLNDEFFSQIVPLMHSRLETLGDFVAPCSFFFAREVSCDAEDLVPKARQAEDVVAMLQTGVWALEEGDDEWGKERVEGAIKRVGTFWDWPIRDITGPMFVAAMGQKVGPPLYESLTLLGIDLSRMRLLKAIDALGGLSKKKSRSLEKAWNQGEPGQRG